MTYVMFNGLLILDFFALLHASIICVYVNVYIL